MQRRRKEESKKRTWKMKEIRDKSETVLEKLELVRELVLKLVTTDIYIYMDLT